MTSVKLILRNVQKNMRDYFIYFLTLMIAVSMFYAFNSIQSQPALHDLDATKQLLSNQLGILLSTLSVVVAVVLAFLFLYANQFLLKRRIKDLGIYTLLGMDNRCRCNFPDMRDFVGTSSFARDFPVFPAFVRCRYERVSNHIFIECITKNRWVLCTYFLYCDAL